MEEFIRKFITQELYMIPAYDKTALVRACQEAYELCGEPPTYEKFRDILLEWPSSKVIGVC